MGGRRLADRDVNSKYMKEIKFSAKRYFQISEYPYKIKTIRISKKEIAGININLKLDLTTSTIQKSS